jgi:hypothetical protein
LLSRDLPYLVKFCRIIRHPNRNRNKYIFCKTYTFGKSVTGFCDHPIKLTKDSEPLLYREGSIE